MMNKCEAYRKINFTKNAKHVIDIMQPTEVQGAMGGFDVTWGVLATVRAVIIPMSQQETFRYDKLDSRVKHKIYVRYQSVLSNPLVTAKYHIIFNNRRFEIIEAINLYEDDKYISIIAMEVLS